MNGLEQWYWDTHIIPLMKSDEISYASYESIKFKLADNTWYTPDFHVILKDGTGIFVETKGTFWHDDARAKFKIAAGMYPQFIWKWVVIKGSSSKSIIKEEEL